MPKQKTKKSLLNRFKITKSGKVLKRQAFRRHLNAKKSKRRIHRLKRYSEVTKVFAKKIKKRMGK